MTDQRGPFDPPAAGVEHPQDRRSPKAAVWACPHCGEASMNHSFAHRDECLDNEVHPDDCRCGWCRHGVVWVACPRCGRGCPTAGPDQPAVAECPEHGQVTVSALDPEPDTATPVLDGQCSLFGDAQ